MDALTNAFHQKIAENAVRRELARQRREASDRAVESYARRTVVCEVKYAASRYDRTRDLSRSTGVYQQYCADMNCAEAIRRLTTALTNARASYKRGLSEGGVISKKRFSRSEIIHIKAALLCERLARRRDYAQAKADDAWSARRVSRFAGIIKRLELELAR